MKVFSIRLNVIQERNALRLGKGNLSAGVREALASVGRKGESKE